MAMTPSDLSPFLLREVVNRLNKRVITGIVLASFAALFAGELGNDKWPPIFNDPVIAADGTTFVTGLGLALFGALKPDEKEKRRGGSSQDKTGANSNEREDDEGDQSGSLKS
jgi:hypothetical protein